ncbi:hypothetical protein Isop_3708 [Isosphaera pallida ATCC 43644]|jgi:hypothetical protein|uniref:Uncharacterized protein n=1 Tax=Isosphaera pallida (strain ATCC 43644 / DSM 9630 / IS1B) TaxID=575540 RepID=E8QZY8_ISOPI|nr:hypothetical protein [Isosphaera pallida]ADV64264.1 hypothetical protein Isop_3708 [Isosphaera pallida ATCC 43644]
MSRAVRDAIRFVRDVLDAARQTAGGRPAPAPIPIPIPSSSPARSSRRR